MGLYSSGGSATVKTYKPEPLGGGGGSLNVEQSDAAPGGEAGKGSIDLTDPAASIGQSIGAIGEFAGNVAGGVFGALGSIGPDGETASLGQLAEDVGRIPGGVGDFKLPYLGNDPEKQQATLAQLPGAIYEPVYQAQQGVLERAAEARVLDYQKGVGQGRNDIPEDIQAALDAGELTVDQAADVLLERGASVSSDPGAQLAGEIVLDPLNFIAPGVGKAAQGIKGAGMAVRTADDLAALGVGQRAAGTIYNTATKGMSQAGAAAMDRVIGPVTSGVFHTLGTKPYRALVSGAGKLDRAYGLQFERSFALGAGQLPRAVIAREVMQDTASKLASKVDDAEGSISRRLQAKKITHGDELERRTEELLGRTTPAYPVITDDIADLTVRKYAAASGMSVEDAARVLGKVDRDTARTVHLAFYGKAGGDLAEIKKVLPSTKKLDVERLTVIAPDTLTDELADAIVAGDIGVADAVDNFSVLSNHFGAKVVSDSEVLDFIKKLRPSLPEAVRLPKSGKNALPKELGDWRARNSEFGYELGFAPKDGWKSIVDADGEVIMSDPFVHFVSDVDPVTMRNPLGRFMDGLMRGTTQTVIVQESRQRMVDFLIRNKVPISPNEVRAVHKAILEEAADRGLTPRALVGERTKGTIIYDDIFRRILSTEAYDGLVAKYDPTFVVMEAFKGNWQTVGLTQKLTGAVKALPQGGPIIAKLTESLYPKARFTFRPTFQAQEVIESPVFNALRGVTDRPVADDLVDAYRALAEQPEFRYLTEANFLNIAGVRRTEQFMGANTAVGRATARFGNIAARKETARIRQTMYEHGEDFQRAVREINPKFWAAMEEAYGTTDPRLIADKFLTERMALASGNIDDTMRLVDDASEMFHVTTAKDAVAREGLKPRSTTGRIGLGGGEEDMAPDLISATTNAERADAIENTLRLAVRAARDEVDTNEIFAHFRGQFDSPEEVATLTGRTFGQKTWDDIADDFADFGDSGEGKYELVALLDNAVLMKGKMSVGLTSGWEAMAKIDPSQIAKLRVRARGAAKEAFDPEQELRFAEGDLLIEAERAAGAVDNAASDMVLQAFKDSFREASNRAFQTHFFNPQRGWLERTLNHPYLGLYPLSYMWGKVLPEFARFLIKRPFGRNVPLVGLVNLERVQQAYLGALADDPEFSKYIEENGDAIYFANLLFPGNPVNMTVNAPAWARHVSEDAAAGKLKDPGKTVTREIVDSGSYAFGPIHDLTSVNKTGADLVDIGSDIFKQLTRSAAQFDGQFPQGAPRPPLTGTPLTP